MVSRRGGVPVRRRIRTPKNRHQTQTHGIGISSNTPTRYLQPPSPRKSCPPSPPLRPPSGTLPTHPDRKSRFKANWNIPNVPLAKNFKTPLTVEPKLKRRVLPYYRGSTAPPSSAYLDCITSLPSPLKLPYLFHAFSGRRRWCVLDLGRIEPGNQTAFSPLLWVFGFLAFRPVSSHETPDLSSPFPATTHQTLRICIRCNYLVRFGFRVRTPGVAHIYLSQSHNDQMATGRASFNVSGWGSGLEVLGLEFRAMWNAHLGTSERRPEAVPDATVDSQTSTIVFQVYGCSWLACAATFWCSVCVIRLAF